MFGTGVILATSITHMFFPAVQFLSNPCLPTFWLEDYPAFAGVFFLLAILMTQALQVALTIKSDKALAKMVTDSTADKDTADLEKNMESGESSAITKKTAEGAHEHSHVHMSLLRERQLSAYLLEIGIFSHSVLIGITLGVARSEFVSLLIALSFHQ